jgi:ubiquinone/menaquinone biosynthesis C-methylase UbiE
MRKHALCIEGTVCPRWMIRIFDNPLRYLIHSPRRILQGLAAEGGTAIDSGSVVAVDRQQAMLEGVRRRAEKKGLSDRIRMHLVGGERIGLATKGDFVLAFWMVHEVPDAPAFLREVRGMLKSDARFLLVEPRIHVNREDFRRTVEAALSAGLRLCGEPRVAISRAALFQSA